MSTKFEKRNLVRTHFRIPKFLLQAGTWEYSITNPPTGPYSQRVAVSITSMSSSQAEYPIVAQAAWGSRTVNVFGDVTEQIVYASVSKGEHRTPTLSLSLFLFLFLSLSHTHNGGARPDLCHTPRQIFLVSPSRLCTCPVC